MKTLDLLNQKFGRSSIVARADNSATGQARWLCRCECGIEKVMDSILLRSGRSKSCGCLKRDMLRKSDLKHGHAPLSGVSPTYNSWSGMVARCTNPNHTTYRLYGGRGVRVCERWLNFANFLEDMGDKPSGTSLDRIDTNGNYEHSNCRWTDAKEQARNKRNNHILTIDGASKTVAEWSELLGIPASTISYRLVHGASDKKALGYL